MTNGLDMSLFAQRLREARKNKGLTQKELSDLSGVSTVMISQYERSEISTGKNPAMNNVYAIAAVLGVSIDWLCGRVSTNENNTKAFLLCYIKLFERVSTEKIDELSEKMKSSLDGISIDVYKPIFGEKKKKCLYHFTKDYLEVLPVLRKGLLPPEIQQTVINKIIDDYVNIPINELISDGFLIEGR